MNYEEFQKKQYDDEMAEANADYERGLKEVDNLFARLAAQENENYERDLTERREAVSREEARHRQAVEDLEKELKQAMDKVSDALSLRRDQIDARYGKGSADAERDASMTPGFEGERQKLTA